MNQDSHLFYRKRKEHFSLGGKSRDEIGKPIKIQIQDVTRVVSPEELKQNKNEQSKDEDSPTSKDEKSLTIGKETSNQSPVKIHQRFDEMKLNNDSIESN